MKIFSDNNKNSLHPNPQILPNQYFQYKNSARKFNLKITNQKKKYINPLYSVQSLTKYFSSKPQLKPKQLTRQFYIKKQNNINKNQNIRKFQQLQQKIRRHQTQYQNLHQKFIQFCQFINKEFDHYTNLNIDDGFCPTSQQFRSNFLITCYLEKLKNPATTHRMTYKKVIQQNRRRVHTQNIQTQMKKQQYQKRYKNLPKTKNLQQNILLENWEVKSRELRAKTQYCRRKYQSPILQKQKLDSQIFDQSKFYMKRKTNSTKSTTRF